MNCIFIHSYFIRVLLQTNMVCMYVLVRNTTCYEMCWVENFQKPVKYEQFYISSRKDLIRRQKIPILIAVVIMARLNRRCCLLEPVKVPVPPIILMINFGFGRDHFLRSSSLTSFAISVLLCFGAAFGYPTRIYYAHNI